MCSHIQTECSFALVSKLERHLLDLGWNVPEGLSQCCSECLESMINDVTGELDAIQKRSLAATSELFTIVPSDSPEYQTVYQRFKETSNNEVVGIEQINNPVLFEEFQNACGASRYEWKWLFHGSNNDNYVNIVKNGFDKNKSKNGLLGRGVYFAEQSSYSLNYTNNLSLSDKLYGNMLLCQVCILPEDQKGDKIYCIQNDRRAYPRYLIYYTI